MKDSRAIFLPFTLVLVTGLLVQMPYRAAWAGAQTASLPSGDEIARRINARDEGVAVSRTLVMELTDRRGKTRVRVTRSFRKFYEEQRRIAIFYERPKNVRGTAFLIYDYLENDREDDQWLYLPALRKTRRISAADRGDYFMGTDFTYDDIKLESKVSIRDYRRKILGIEDLDGCRCYVLEATPVSKSVAKELGYGRVVSWIDPKNWMIRKSAFWDVRGNRLKTVRMSDIRKVQGIWTAHRLEAVNHKTGHKTTFTVADVDYRGGVPDRVFSREALRRGP